MTTDDVAANLAHIKFKAATACGIIPARKNRPIPTQEDKQTVLTLLGSITSLVNEVVAGISDGLVVESPVDNDVIDVLRGFRIQKEHAVVYVKAARVKLGPDADFDTMLREVINQSRK